MAAAEKTIVLKPGAPLPQGTFVGAWQLKGSDYPPRSINLIYIPAETEEKP